MHCDTERDEATQVIKTTFSILKHVQVKFINIRQVIRDLVFATSQLESLANALYSHTVLSFLEKESSTLPEKLFSQGFILACFKTVQSKKANYSVDKELNEQLENSRTILELPSVDYHFKHLSQTINQLARRMHSVLLTSLQERLLSRQKRTIRRQVQSLVDVPKKGHNYIVAYVLHQLNGTNEPDPARFKDPSIQIEGSKWIQSHSVQKIIQSHTEHLKILDEQSSFSRMQTSHIRKHPHLYYPYMYYLKQLGCISFQLIPQFTMKPRSITIGKEQITELVMRFMDSSIGPSEMIPNVSKVPSRKDIHDSKCHRKKLAIDKVQKESMDKKRKHEQIQDEYKHMEKGQKRQKVERTINQMKVQIKKLKEKQEKLQEQAAKLQVKKTSSKQSISRGQILSHSESIMKQYFRPPSKYWNGTITTDGVSISWHLTKARADTTRNDQGKTRTIPSTSSKVVKGHEKPVHYGNHGVSCWISNETDIDIISVDPGHETLIDAVREHSILQEEKIDNRASSKRGQRRSLLSSKLREKNRSTFSLSNKSWQHQCGRLRMRKKELHLREQLPGMKRAIEDLALSSSKVSTSSEYEKHVSCRLKYMEPMSRRMRCMAPRRWVFECYQKEQLAAKKLCKNLLSGCTDKTLVVWGNGGFGPTSKGHASAPNKKLQRLVSKYIPVIVSSEYGSSQISCCCHEPMSACKHKGQTKRVTVKTCTKCHTMLSRDRSAACVIADIFRYQRKLQTLELPSFLKR